MSLVGARVLRKEDPRLLSGTGTFVDDLSPRALHVRHVRRRRARPTPGSCRSTCARRCALDGVLAVFTAADFAEYPPLPGGLPDLERPALAGNVVRFVGEPLAVVVAEDRYVAADAADAIVVEYEPLPPVATIAAADRGRSAGAVPGPRFERRHGRADDRRPRARARARATAGPTCTSSTSAAPPVPIEPMACLADWRRDGLTVWATFQAPHHLRNYLASWLDIAQTRLPGDRPRRRRRLRLEDRLVPRAVPRPGAVQARWAPGEVRPDPHRGDAPDEPRARPGARHRRRLRPRRPDPRAAARRHPEPRRLPRPDRPRAARADHVDGGRRLPHPEGRHVVPHGRHEHDAGRRLPRRRSSGGGVLDRADRRRRRPAHRASTRPRSGGATSSRPSAFPYATHNDAVVYDSADFPKALAECLRLLDYDAVRAEQAQRRDDPSQPLLGIGLSCWLEIAGFGPNGSLEGFGHLASWESAQVRVQPDGSAIVFAGSSPHGQGHETVFAQIAADELGIAFDRIQVRTGDTATVLQGIGTMGSRGVPTSGSAVKVASAAGARRGPRRSPPTCSRPASTTSRSPTRRSTCAARRARRCRGRDVAWASFQPLAIPPELQAGSLEERLFQESPNFSYPSGAYGCVVEIDRDTGPGDDPRQLVLVDDCGTVINPLLAEGQVHGGVAQGVGQALFEAVTYDDDGSAAHVDAGRLPRAVGGRHPRVRRRPDQHAVPEQPARRQGDRRVRRRRGTRRRRQRRRRCPGAVRRRARRHAGDAGEGVDADATERRR